MKLRIVEQANYTQMTDSGTRLVRIETNKKIMLIT